MDNILNPIINTLTGNVTKNNTLVDKVLAKIGELETAKNAALAATGDNATTISTLNEQIAKLTAELNTYKTNLEAANTALETTLAKMVGVVGNVDGKRRKNRSK